MTGPLTLAQHLVAIGCALCLFACDTNNGVATTHEAAAEPAAPGSPLCLTLIGARDQVLTGEPLTLGVTLENCSDEPQTVDDLLAPEFGLLIVRIGGPGKQADRVYYPPVQRDGRGVRAQLLRPTGRLAATIPVYFDRQGWTLDTPGDYRFSAEYVAGKAPLVSNELGVHVRDVTDSRQSEFAAMFMSVAAAKYFYLGGGDATGAATLRRIAESAPESAWAAYARLALSIDAAARSRTTERSADCKAVQAATFDIDDWLIAVRGLRETAACLARTDRSRLIDRVVDSFVERHPASRDFAEAYIRKD